ncbi:MAG: DNA topoisomerase 1 [Alphaproteobacteria bacterium MarineAlpha5_Bin12]|nr:DNA topoisomerase I [Pelagibacteraceae bacterium]PPR41783.1 MAG: DNA topoisomerase 1 [Alphaproteobacteria bacterium MarineAlpha5_Bin12]|tara:strand:+ start:6878 stop:9421 length:2544 start_codon:yes stop_codon:yes gene_type:complete
MNLVIVESPSKAKTINKYLGNNFKVVASMGHVRDLLAKEEAVDTNNNYEMKWEISDKGNKVIKDIKNLAKNADYLYLAPDPDREGEAISWHLEKILRMDNKLENLNIKRITFNEITKEAVLKSLKSPRDLDQNLIDSYMARRVLDFLVGFNLSPVLWRKLPGSKSAGRVQSVALRLIVEREIEIEKFNADEYWSISGNFSNLNKESFNAKLFQFNNKKLEKLDIKNEEQAKDIFNEINKKEYSIDEIETKEVKRNPYPPFSTSTLQQDASSKLGFNANQTMRTAQRLYEGIEIDGDTVGLITYMRTDSIIMSKTAIDEIREYIKTNFGDSYLPEHSRIYKSKAKNAQEAHECVRPTSILRKPDEIKKSLREDEFKLYDLIWKRSLSSQMESAIINQVSIKIKSSDNNDYFKATGSTIKFDGMIKVYQEYKEKNNEENENRLPVLQKNDKLNLTNLEKKQHFTQPAPRYSEASLVKKLEELGIGRPSTYASIIQVLQDRNYVEKDNKRFIANDRGRVVAIFLIKYFQKYVQYDYTADLEKQLDEISGGKLNWIEVINNFWKNFKPTVDDTISKRNSEIIDVLDAELGSHFFPPSGEDSSRKCKVCNNGRLGLKIGKFGGFIGCSNYPECKNTLQFAQQLEIVKNGDDSLLVTGPKEIGKYPETGETIFLKKGPYGPYMQLGEGTNDKKPKRVSIPKNFTPEDLGINTAIKLLGLPRKLGFHPDTNKTVSAGIGMYGPYVLHDKKYKALEKDDNILDIELNRAIELIAKATTRGNSILRTLGEHPSEKNNITVHNGKFGPYVKCGKINASIMSDSTPETIGLNEAIDLIDGRKSKIGVKKTKKTKSKNK